jgi:hypothetical protein
MGKKSSFEGAVRSYGGGKKGVVTPSVAVQAVMVSMDPTSATAKDIKVGADFDAGSTFVLPKGSIVLDLVFLDTGTGGTNPTLDVGHDAETDYLFSNLPSDTAVNAVVVTSGGVSTENAISGTTAEYTIQALGGTGTDATGGSVTGIIRYVTYDDGMDSV